MAEANVETLLTIPDAQLHEVRSQDPHFLIGTHFYQPRKIMTDSASVSQVAHGKESLKEWGPLNVTIHNFQGESGLWLQVGIPHDCSSRPAGNLQVKTLQVQNQICVGLEKNSSC